MYIEKRWFVPATLTLLLLGALAAVLVLRGSATAQGSGAGHPEPIRSIESAPKAPESIAAQASTSDPSPAAIPAAEAAPATQVLPAAAPAPVVAETVPQTTAPEEVVAIGTVGSDDTQINTRGFGDVGLQFDEVTNTAPITIVHVSSQGNNNTTNINIGNNDQITSNQDHLQSNRSDGGEPVATAPGTGTPTG